MGVHEVSCQGSAWAVGGWGGMVGLEMQGPPSLSEVTYEGTRSGENDNARHLDPPQVNS